jgi:hypothetical protein
MWIQTHSLLSLATTIIEAIRLTKWLEGFSGQEVIESWWRTPIEVNVRVSHLCQNGIVTKVVTLLVGVKLLAQAPFIGL